MFGFSLGEVILIAIVAIVVLGPDKLPSAVIQVARLFKSLRKVLDDAKSTLDKELHIEELKKEALEYKQKFEREVQGIKSSIDIRENISNLAQENLNDVNNMFKDYKPKNLTLDSNEVRSEEQGTDKLDEKALIEKKEDDILLDTAKNEQNIESKNAANILNQLNQEVDYDDFNIQQDKPKNLDSNQDSVSIKKVGNV